MQPPHLVLQVVDLLLHARLPHLRRALNRRQFFLTREHPAPPCPPATIGTRAAPMQARRCDDARLSDTCGGEATVPPIWQAGWGDRAFARFARYGAVASCGLRPRDI